MVHGVDVEQHKTEVCVWGCGVTTTTTTITNLCRRRRRRRRRLHYTFSLHHPGRRPCIPLARRRRQPRPSGRAVGVATIHDRQRAAQPELVPRLAKVPTSFGVRGGGGLSDFFSAEREGWWWVGVVLVTIPPPRRDPHKPNTHPHPLSHSPSIRHKPQPRPLAPLKPAAKHNGAHRGPPISPHGGHLQVAGGGGGAQTGVQGAGEGGEPGSWRHLGRRLNWGQSCGQKEMSFRFPPSSLTACPPALVSTSCARFSHTKNTAPPKSFHPPPLPPLPPPPSFLPPPLVPLHFRLAPPHHPH